MRLTTRAFIFAVAFLLAGSVCAVNGQGSMNTTHGNTLSPPEYKQTAKITLPPRVLPAVSRSANSDATTQHEDGPGTGNPTRNTLVAELPYCRETWAVNFLDYGRCWQFPAPAQTCPAYAPCYDSDRNRCYQC
jgi:hypothetical protein